VVVEEEGHAENFDWSLTFDTSILKPNLITLVENVRTYLDIEHRGPATGGGHVALAAAAARRRAQVRLVAAACAPHGEGCVRLFVSIDEGMRAAVC
jgi:hypothetical protein